MRKNTQDNLNFLWLWIY